GRGRLHRRRARSAARGPGQAIQRLQDRTGPPRHRSRPDHRGRNAMSDKAIGAAIDRVDGRLKVTGAALYTADASVSGVAHGFIVGSLVARGRVGAIDTTAARAAPGVVGVVTHENMPRLAQPGSDFLQGGMLNEDRLPLSDDRIHYAGQYLAVVVADTAERGRHAASLVKVADADEEPPLAALEDARQFEDGQRDPFGQPLQYHRGDAEKALTAGGLVTIEETDTTPVETHNPREMCATVAEWDGDRRGSGPRNACARACRRRSGPAFWTSSPN